MMAKRRRLFGFLSVLGSILGLVLVFSSTGAQPFAVPRSDLVIDGQISLAGGPSARFIARDGTLVSLRDSRPGGGWYAFSPVVDQSSDSVNIASYSIASLDTGGERLEQFFEQDVRVGSSGTFSLSSGSIEIKVLDVRPGKFSRAAMTDVSSIRPFDLQRRFGAIGGGLCSLACGHFSVGANSVRMSCGTCQGEGSTFVPAVSSEKGR